MSMCHWQRVAVSICLVAIGMFLGSLLSAPSTAWGEVRTTPVPPAFQSGGQQSVPILRDISATLQQIDGRLARLETLAKQLKIPSSHQ